MSNKSQLVIFKVVLLGNSGVGKSNLLSRLNSNEFSDDFKSTIGVEFLTKILEVNGERVKAQIWDTAGQERFSSMMGTYYRNAKGAMLVYDVSDPESLEAISRWNKELLEHAAKDCVCVLVGNKCDLESERRVSAEDGAKVAREHGMIFVESSAKTGHNVQTAFTDLMAGVYRASLRQKRAAARQDVRFEAANDTNKGVNLAAATKDGAKKSSDCC